MRMRKFMCVLALVATAGCGGGSDGGGSLPADVQEIMDYLVAESRGSAAFFQQAPQALLLAVLDPDAATAAGIAFEETSPPGTYELFIPFDADGDGETDATVSGMVVLSAAGPTGVTGTIEATISTAAGASAVATLAFELTPDGITFSGLVTFSDPVAGYTGEIVILDTDPVTVKEPGAGAVENLCTGSAQGNVQVRVTRAPVVTGGSPLYLEAIIELLFSSQTARLTHAASGESPGSTSDLPDSNLDLGCAASIQDWVGTFDTTWFCPPGSNGAETHTFTVTGPNTVQVSKAEVGSSTPTVFTATTVPGNPHVLVGEFTEGDPAYTETFRYTLSPDGSLFTQDNEYEYIEGPLTGSGGPCYGTGHRR